jgi:DNA-directed RNA polymerase subunit RPC12/RpoP
MTFLTDDLVFDCLMCGTPLLIREQDRNERLQCPVCGEIMLSTDHGMQVDPGEDFTNQPKSNPLSLLIYGPMLAVVLLIAAAIFFFAVCFVVPIG